MMRGLIRYLKRTKDIPEKFGMAILAVAIIGGIVSGVFIQRDKISPIGVGYQDPTLVIESAAQVDRATPAVRLINSLTDSSQSPCYDMYSNTEPCDQQTADVPLEMARDSNTGAVRNDQFFRFQGKFSYTGSDIPDVWTPLSSSGMNSRTDVAYSTWNSTNGRICVGTFVFLGQGKAVCRSITNPNASTFNYSGSLENGWETIVADGIIFQGKDLVTQSAFKRAGWAWPTCRINGRVSSDVIPFNSLGFEDVGPNLGDCPGQGFYSAAIYQNKLFVGTRNLPEFGNNPAGAQIWQYSGTNMATEYAAGTLQSKWRKVVNNGFNSNRNTYFSNMFVFNNKLFVSVANNTTPAKLLVYNGSNWTMQPSLPGASNNSYVSGSAVFNGKQYINVYGRGTYYSDDGNTWTYVDGCGGRGMVATATQLFCGSQGGVDKSSNGLTFTNSTSTIIPWSLGVADNKIIASTGTWINLDPDRGAVRGDGRVWCLGCSTQNNPESKLTIKLPPRLVFKPDQLVFEDDRWSFNLSDPNNPVSVHQSGPNNYTALISLKHQGDGDNRGKYYEITISGFEKRAEEYNYRLTLVPSASGSDIASLGLYLEQGNKDNIYLGGGDCSRNLRGYICFDTDVIVEVPEILNNGVPLPIRLAPPMREKIPIPDINISGNVAATNGDLADFRIASDKAIAVGGSINIRGSGSQLPNYPATRFNWLSVSATLGSLLTKGLEQGQAPSTGNQYNSQTWYLNSVSSNPQSAVVSSYSSPPEGKLWKVQGDLTINNSVTFKGAGTIVVSGNLIIRDKLHCDSARLAFLVGGNITFKSPTDQNEQIDCGGFAALGGKITFENVREGQVKGIFIARDDIDLPSRSTLIRSYSINYDEFLANNPTILFKDVLKIIFTTSS